MRLLESPAYAGLFVVFADSLFADGFQAYGPCFPIERSAEMNRPVKAMVAAVALTLTLALPAGAGAQTKWVCVVNGEPVTFVTAADAARHGIEQANSKAGVVFHDLFGEDCHVE
jgi:hypothetical protein